MTLNNRQELFVSEYLKCFNATKAAKAAGYSEKTAYSQGHDLLKVPEIAARVRERLRQSAMDADEVLHHLAEIARGDMDDLVDINGNLDMTKARQFGKTKLIKKVKNRVMSTENTDITETETEGYDRLRALELIGKHLAMWTDKVQVNDWRAQAIQDIKDGKISFEALSNAFDKSLAAELFTAAGIPLSSE